MWNMFEYCLRPGFVPLCSTAHVQWSAMLCIRPILYKALPGLERVMGKVVALAEESGRIGSGVEVERVQHKDACCWLFPLPCMP